MGEDSRKPRPIPARQTGLDPSLQIRRQGRGALDGGRMPDDLEPHQPPEMRKNGRTITASGSDDVLHHIPDTVLIEQDIHQTETEQLLGFDSSLFVDFYGY